MRGSGNIPRPEPFTSRSGYERWASTRIFRDQNGAAGGENGGGPSRFVAGRASEPSTWGRGSAVVGAAVGPGAEALALGADPVGDGRLVPGRLLVGHAPPAVGLPGAHVELEAAV